MKHPPRKRRRAKPRPRARKTTAPADARLAQLAYEHLQEQLWSGFLTAGAKISEARLAKRLEMSPTPVREAIRRMETEGVVVQVASSGTYVAVAERAEIVEACEVRMAIESFAVRKAARRMKPAQIAALQKRCDQMRAAIREFRASKEPVMTGETLRRYLNADLAFHLLLLQAADNRRALAIFGDVSLRSAIFGGRNHQRDLHHVAWVWLRHARIALAVRRREADAAERWLQAHVQASMHAALEAHDARQDRIPIRNPTGLTDAMAELIAALREPAHSHQP